MKQLRFALPTRYSRILSFTRPLLRFGRRCKGSISRWASVTFLIPSATLAATTANVGIASRYPGDKNIASDPAVILADNFESYTDVSQLTRIWSKISWPRYMRLATTNAYAGTKSIEMTLPVSTREVGRSINKLFSPGFDSLYCRAYMRWDPGYNVNTSNHNGIYMGGGNDPLTGQKPNGKNFFVLLVQNNDLKNEGPPGWLHEYAYTPDQQHQWGDHWYPNGIGFQVARHPDFKPLPNFLPVRGRWYCYEQMVRLNTPGKRDGEVKIWVDGKLTADWPDLLIRTVKTLKIDEVYLNLHALHSERINKKWYDNVVIAKQYIGPMSIGSAITAPAMQFPNFSSRLPIGTGDKVGIAGFVIGGSEPKTLLIRGLGPTLAQLGITEVMQSPTLELHDETGSLVAMNHGWKNTQQAAIAATALAPQNDSESAIIATLDPGSYTIVQADAGGGTGEGLLEIYDLDPGTDSNLVNMSTRGLVRPGDGALISGCSIEIGSGSNNVLIRAIGPSLSQAGINAPLPDPVLTLFDRNGNVITTNDNWKQSQQAVIENTGLRPADDREAAIYTALRSGNYTAMVTGKAGNTGLALLEVYSTR
jgi:uncharacterized protein (DUF2141 family)